MHLATKPQPSEKFYKLSARESSLVAMRVAKQNDTGQTDWQVFREWTQAWNRRNRSRNLTLA